MKSIVIGASLLAATIAAHAQTNNIDKNMPRVVNGKLIDPLTPAPAPKTYPRLNNEGKETRLEVKKDVSLGGNVTADSVSGNVKFPIPEKK